MYSEEVDRAVREAAARLTPPSLDHYGDLLDTVIACATYALSVPEPLPFASFSFLEPNETPAAVAADLDHLFGRDRPKPAQAKAKRPTGTCVFLSGRATMTVDAEHRISKSDLLASDEYQRRALDVPWPDEFVMENGRDRRPLKKLENRDVRHQIDWHRDGSHVEAMPNIDDARRENNPYAHAKGTAHAVAYHTWDVFVGQYRGCASFEEIVDEVMARGMFGPLSFPDTAYNRNAVRDTLRDCALFGLVVRCKEGRKTVFVLPGLLA